VLLARYFYKPILSVPMDNHAKAQALAVLRAQTGKRFKTTQAQSDSNNRFSLSAFFSFLVFATTVSI
jgi:phosphoserine phosphatase